MLLKGKIKLKVWGWLLKKDQVSEDNSCGEKNEASDVMTFSSTRILQITLM